MSGIIFTTNAVMGVAAMGIEEHKCADGRFEHEAVPYGAPPGVGVLRDLADIVAGRFISNETLKGTPRATSAPNACNGRCSRAGRLRLACWVDEKYWGDTRTNHSFSD